MAKVIWQKRAEKELFRYLVRGNVEFGETVANRFATRISHVNNELSKFPETGFPEPLLKERKKLYRAYPVLKCFKLIYYYAQSTDTVHVADIWDTRREPTSLVKRIK